MSLKEIEAKIREAGSDGAAFFGGSWTGGYYIQQDPKEFAELVQLLQGFQFDNYLAIGIAAGGVERFICENVSVKRLTVIDDGEHPNHRHWDADAVLGRGDVIEFIGNSHSSKAKEFLRVNHGAIPFNLVGIDGDHSPQGVLQDWEMVQPYLAPGCLVWFHDIHVSEIGQHGGRKLWARLKNEHEVCLETNGRFGIGVIRVA